MLVKNTVPLSRHHSKIKMLCVICGRSCPWKCYNVLVYEKNSNTFLACAACAIFFRRSVVNVFIYECNCPKTAESIARCKSCRLQKCFDYNMAATQIRNLGRLVDHGTADTHLFAGILDNVLKTCKQHPSEAINYLLNGTKTLLELASTSFIYKPPSNSTPRHIRIWSAMLDIQGIKSDDLPKLLETILYRLISRYSREIQQQIFDKVTPANSRILLFQQLSLYMLAASHYE